MKKALIGLILLLAASTVWAQCPVVTAATITPAKSNLAVGTMVQLKSTWGFADSSTQDETAITSFASSDPKIASVDAKGLLTAVSVGTVTITGTAGPVIDTTTLTVTQYCAGKVCGPDNNHNTLANAECQNLDLAYHNPGKQPSGINYEKLVHSICHTASGQ